MKFELEEVVPWGRNLKEYREMFNLSNNDLDKNIISFGDGPASFNSELNNLEKKCTSIDLIYQFSENELKERFEVVKKQVLKQVRNNTENFTWKSIKTPDELECLRVKSMSDFLKDFSKGKKEERYIYHSLPEKLNFEKQTFDLGLSSHFLLLYPKLGFDFHIKSINEMLRLCKEVRIFPILNLNAEKSEMLDDVISHFKNKHLVNIEKVKYEFQKGGNEMLTIQHNSL
ncbi:hypothetical protein [Polaribacter sargassicola]|uniref:hypothetical protein n=1 Tax=Polaribacter sargassicola TaxID=2836891 RepID=UPI001F2E42A0|nr:hypothetical protein [Polaribacter sp. DS7-9]MCG1037646.1 hypothetical protein [Polaribacter sp. DS7-9]